MKSPISIGVYFTLFYVLVADAAVLGLAVIDLVTFCSTGFSVFSFSTLEG